MRGSDPVTAPRIGDVVLYRAQDPPGSSSAAEFPAIVVRVHTEADPRSALDLSVFGRGGHAVEYQHYVSYHESELECWHRRPD